MGSGALPLASARATRSEGAKSDGDVRRALRRLVLVGDYPPPVGGIAVHVERLHRFLGARGVEVLVLNVGKGGRPDPDVVPVRSASRLAVRVAEQSLQGATVHVHTSGNNRRSWLLAAGVAMARAPGASGAVLTVHSGLAPEFLESAWAHRRLAALALRTFDQVIAVSRAIDDAVGRLGIPQERRAVLPAFLGGELTPGAPPPAFQHARRTFPVLLAAAHHPSPVYGRRVLLEAMRQLAPRHPGMGLVLFGPGADPASLAPELSAPGLAGRVVGLGELDPAQSLAVIAKADAFLRPTLADGDSVSVREALALGIRCVASDAAIRPRGVWTFPSGDALALACSIEGALAQPAPPPSVVDVGEQLMRIYTQLRGGWGERWTLRRA